MKRISRTILLALTIALPALPAVATPPDIIEVRDEIFGISASYVFLLRSTRDNLGLYTSDRSDTLLVALEVATGVETLWPVYSVYRGQPESDPSGETTAVFVTSGKDSVNPFEILAKYQAVPVAGAWDHSRSELPPRLALTDGELTMTYPESGAVYRLDGPTLQSGLTASINRLANMIEDYERVAPITTRSLLADRSYVSADCAVSEPRRISALIEATPVQLARVTCTEQDGLDETSLFVIVPPAAD